MIDAAHSTFRRACLALCLALSLMAGAFASPVGDLVGRMPTATAEEGHAISAQLLDMGPEAIAEVCDMLVPPGTGDDTKARFALGAIAMYAQGPEGKSQREMCSKALIAALQSAADDEICADLIRHIQIVGGNEAVAPLAKYLADDNLCEPAAQALVEIGTPKAGRALAHALAKAEGKRAVTLVKSVGEIGARSASDKIEPYAASEDTDLRRTALFALGNLGALSSVKTLAKAAETQEPYERSQATSFYLLLAKRLGEHMCPYRKAKAATLCRKLYAARTAEAGVQAAALSTLVGIRGKGALGDLIDATDSDNKQVREAALKLASEIPGERATKQWIAKAGSAKPAARSEIVAMLGRRGDKSALPTLVAALKDAETDVRLAAIEATARLDAESAVAPLIAFLAEAQEAAEIEAAQGALARMQGDAVLAALADALPAARPAGRAAMLDILGSRHASAHAEAVFLQASDSNENVRTAAVKALGNIATPDDMPRLVALLLEAETNNERKAAQDTLAEVAGAMEGNEARGASLVDALETAPAEKQMLLIATMPRVGGATALEAVAVRTRSDQPDVRDAGIRALAKWPDVAAADELLRVARTEEPLTLYVLALRAHVRVVGDASADRMTDEQRVFMLRDALAAARRDEEKQLVIGALGNVPTVRSLETVVPLIAEPSLQKDAVAAAKKIAESKELAPLRDTNAVMDHEWQATRVLEAQEGFEMLFNEKDMTGWVGNTKGYLAENGKIVVHPELGGGDLYTEREFADFILRFEFKLTPGANNGLGIRAPLEGNAAYNAMELQILDNTADKYKNLKPYQYHGSVYGVAPAKRGFQKPVGEWNVQEVIAKGRHITVNLNGTTIVDVDLDEVSKDGTIDGGSHPGLRNFKGHIGFLGHGDPLEFRRIRIQDLGEGVRLAPEGFTDLFNRKDLTGWKGLVEDPIKRAQMTPEELAQAQAKADEDMKAHWKVVDGVLVFDGQGHSLCTARDYKDFEMLVDWKIEAKGDSGIYLRGTPQVQIWDTAQWPEGSGGLYNNQNNPRSPLAVADKPIGEWNTFRIKMVGERVTVHLNGVLVVDDTVLENYWDRSQPIFPWGQIELQSHGSNLAFRNVFIREIHPEGFVPLFNGKDLTGWKGLVENPIKRAQMTPEELAAAQQKADEAMRAHWKVEKGVLVFDGLGHGTHLCTDKDYGDFEMLVDWKIGPKGDSGIYLRGTPQVQIWDTAQWPEGSGGLYNNQKNPSKPLAVADKPIGEWNSFRIKMIGERVTIHLNDVLVVDNAVLENYWDRQQPIFPKEQIELQSHGSTLYFRNVLIHEIESKK